MNKIEGNETIIIVTLINNLQYQDLNHFTATYLPNALTIPNKITIDIKG